MDLKVVGGWAVLIAAGGAIYWVGNQKKNKNRRIIAPKVTATKTPESRKEPKAKKAKKDTKQQSEQPQAPKADEKVRSSVADEKDDDEVDNREFARQLSNAKSGTVMSGKAQITNNRTKSVKQTRAQEKPVVESSDNASAPSSTTGDADNDESPVGSPELAATPVGTATNGDVSDMLEKTTSGPQVMKITAPTNQTQKKAKTAKPAEVQETKKQRQNRLKAEEKRIAREAEEKERKVLEERQRRTAREAEGRAAKDGSAFMASKAPASSVWTAPKIEGQREISKAEFLDTFEPAQTNGNAKPASKTSSNQLADEYNGFSEEEQIRRIQEESEDNWETVSKAQRKKRNPAKQTADSSEEKQVEKDFSTPPVIKPTGPGQVWAQKTVHVEPETRKIVEREMEIQDSEWEVA